MRVFGRSPRADESQSPVPDEELFVSTARNMVPGCGDTFWVMDGRTGRMLTLPAHLAGVLPHVGIWRTRAGHVESLMRSGWAGHGASLIGESLDALAESGVLLSRSKLARMLRERPGSGTEAPKVSGSYWCTRERLPVLRKSMEGFIRNFIAHDRDLDYYVFDDARRPESRLQTRRALAGLKAECFTPDLRLHYCGEEEKRAFCRAIAEKAGPDGPPEEVVDFGIFGIPDCGLITLGANRNTALLCTVGDLCIHSDDDTQCRYAGPANGESGGLEIFSLTEPAETESFPDMQALLDRVNLQEPDVARCYEELLGREVGDLVLGAGRALALERSLGKTAAEIVRYGGKVAITSAGTCGEAGFDAPRFIVGLTGESRLKVMATDETYRAARRSRTVLYRTGLATISRTMLHVGAQVGIDGRSLLPPFFPVARNEFGIFDEVLKACFPRLYTSRVPWAVVHDPMEKRSLSADAISTFTTGFSEILLHLIHSFSGQQAPLDPAERLAALGRYLSDVGNLDDGDFLEVVRERYLEDLSRYSASLEESLRIHKGEPAAWADDLNALLDGIAERVESPELCIPDDIRTGKSATETLAFTKELIVRYGELLEWWPMIWEAAVSVRAEGAILVTI